MTPQEIAEGLNTKVEQFKAQLETAASKEDVTAVTDALEAFKTEQATKLEGLVELTAKLEKLENAAVKQGEVLQAMKGNDPKVGKTLKQELTEKKADIAKAVKQGIGEVEVKALTNRASVANSPSGYMLPDIGQLGVKERSLYNVLPKVNITDGNDAGVVRYRDWDEATTVRAAAMVAEGAAFPESTAKWEWYSKPLRKIGDSLPVTEEFFEDEAQAAAELEMFLDVNVNTKVDDEIVNGNNTGQSLDGLYNTAPVYTPVASGIAAPNLKDLAIKMRNSITRNRGSKYKVDMCLVSSSTMEGLVLAKDANNNYIFDENTGTLGGLAVVVDENMADNTFLVGDRRYARIYEKTGVVISRGTVNNQFLEDEISLKARKRLLLLVRQVDKTGFAKVADVDAALATLGTTPA